MINHSNICFNTNNALAKHQYHITSHQKIATYRHPEIIIEVILGTIMILHVAMIICAPFFYIQNRKSKISTIKKLRRHITSNMMNKKELDIIYYDTETTGLKATTERIIEIAFIKESDGSTFSTLINPEKLISSAAYNVHHISNEMVKDQPTFSEVIQKMCQFISKPALLVAHNNDGFDIHFMREEFKRCNQVLPTHWIFIDSLKWARKYRKDLPSYSLQNLRKLFKIDENNAHRALDDVIILQKVFQYMTDGLDAYQIAKCMGKENLVNEILNNPEILLNI